MQITIRRRIAIIILKNAVLKGFNSRAALIFGKISGVKKAFIAEIGAPLENNQCSTFAFSGVSRTPNVCSHSRTR